MISPDLMDQINLYLDNQITVSDLEDWLVPREPWLLRNPISDDANFVGVIELGLAEIGSDIRTEDEFRETLRQEVLNKSTTLRPTFLPTDSQVEYGTANSTVSPPVIFTNQYQITAPVES